MKEEPTKEKPIVEQFKYLQISPKDKSWGLAVSTVGYRQSTPQNSTATHHPDGYEFPEDGHRVLNEYQLVYITRGAGYFESASCAKTKKYVLW